MNDAILIEGVNYRYPDGKIALNNINIKVENNEAVGIIGANGSGKTTLLLNLNGILRGEGLVSILGLEMTKTNLKEIRSKVGLVFQNPEDQLFCPTVFEDVAFGLLNQGLDEAEVINKVDEILSALELDGFKETISHHLSAGEKKRVALATVLVMNPEILVLDEPTANLDPHSRRQLLKILQGLNHTKIIATHDLELVLELTEKTILLNKGEIKAAGKTKDILSDKKLMEENLLELPLSLALKKH
ncbi:MAG: ABC transporter ATP-binding protein [Candidatus Firestonebacteria bacterium]|nr:ABC transporter ATP-binding protein [Candidatus Firestonebacteria bacterium]